MTRSVQFCYINKRLWLFAIPAVWNTLHQFLFNRWHNLIRMFLLIIMLFQPFFCYYAHIVVYEVTNCATLKLFFFLTAPKKCAKAGFKRLQLFLPHKIKNKQNLKINDPRKGHSYKALPIQDTERRETQRTNLINKHTQSNTEGAHWNK